MPTVTIPDKRRQQHNSDLVAGMIKGQIKPLVSLIQADPDPKT
jgi:hypothetical protein